MARRRIQISKFKTAVQHAGTLLLNSGFAQAPDSMDVLRTQGGARTLTGDSQTIQSFAITDEVVRTGDIVKYINLFLQVCARPNVSVNQNRVGWLEWAFVMVKESETAVPITQLGVQTLGNVCTNMFRNECIYTGAVPCFDPGSNYAEIKIKVPKFKQKIRLGDAWRFITFWRSSNAADTQTDTMRVVKSFMYKTYS